MWGLLFFLLTLWFLGPLPREPQVAVLGGLGWRYSGLQEGRYGATAAPDGQAPAATRSAVWICRAGWDAVRP
jgi:hypothetical protein